MPDSRRLAEKCLWGIYDTTERGRVKLEVATRDLRMFTVNQLLDRGYHGFALIV